MHRLALGALALLASGSLVHPDLARAHDGGSERGSGRKVTEARAAEGFDRIALRGSLDVEVEEGGDVRARELTARSARLSISGSGDIAATVEGGTFSATVDGSGDVVWWGSARPGALAVSGSGSVHHRE